MPKAQPRKPFGKVKDTETLKLLMDNIHQLEYRWSGGATVLKHPYFNRLISANPSATSEVTRRFCEAIIQLLEKHERLKDA